MTTAQYPAYCSGTLNYLLTRQCWSQSQDAWQRQAGALDTAAKAAAPPAPTGPALTVPPANGDQAAELVQALANEEMRRQQALDAQQVDTFWQWRAASAAEDAASSAAAAAAALNPKAWLPDQSTLIWILAGTAGVLILLTRRYTNER